MTFGVTPQGFRRKTFEEVRASLETRLKQRLGQDFDVSDETIDGQILAIYARELALGWEQLEILYHSFDDEKAEDMLLVALAKLTGTRKRGATYSTVVLECDLAEGTTLLTGTHFANAFDKPDSRWTPATDFSAPATGTYERVFRAEFPGPVAANHGTITVINTQVVGWTSVAQPNSAVPGEPADTNETLRRRRREQLGASGNGTVAAIRAKVAKVANVLSAEVFENDTDHYDSEGRPPHSFEVLVFDGINPLASNDAIARAIWSARGNGIPTFGTTSVTIADDEGKPQTVRFSRVSVVPVYAHLVVEKDAGLDDSEIVESFVEAANALTSVGESVRYRRVDSLVYELAGVRDVTDFRLGLSSSPTGTTNVPITVRQIARFDTSRTTISSTTP